MQRFQVYLHTAVVAKIQNVYAETAHDAAAKVAAEFDRSAIQRCFDVAEDAVETLSFIQDAEAVGDCYLVESDADERRRFEATDDGAVVEVDRPLCDSRGP
jgi:hypothetical protein